MSDDLDICTCRDVADIVAAALTDQPPPECPVHRPEHEQRHGYALNDGDSIAASLGMTSTDTQPDTH